VTLPTDATFQIRSRPRAPRLAVSGVAAIALLLAVRLPAVAGLNGGCPFEGKSQRISSSGPKRCWVTYWYGTHHSGMPYPRSPLSAACNRSRHPPLR
jgi:hypothetical protein